VTAVLTAPRRARRPRRRVAVRRVDVARLAARWQRALDAAERALACNRAMLSQPESERLSRHLASERAAMAGLLARLARENHVP
jgi:hypothetical protein